MSVATLRHIIRTQVPGIDGTGITTIEKNQLIADILSQQHAIEGVKTMAYDVRDLVSDPSGATDVTAELQSAINNLPDGAVLYSPAGSVANLTDTITVSSPLHIRGEGEFRFTAGVANKSGFQVSASHSSIEGVKITNPNLLASPTGASSRAINILADYVLVANTHIDGWETGVYQNAAGEFYGVVIDGNIITNVNGVGSEAKGDGIMCVGSGVIITNNLVEARVGTDARCGIVIEGLPPYKVTNLVSNATNIDETAFVVQGNIVKGPFRRSIHAEGCFDYVISDNVCIGARWWGAMLASGDRGTFANNHILWTENGSAGAPGGIKAPLYLLAAGRSRVTGNTIRIDAGTVWSHAIHLGHQASGEGGSSIPPGYILDGNTTMILAGGTGNHINGINLINGFVTIRNHEMRGGGGAGVYLWTTGLADNVDCIVSGVRTTGISGVQVSLTNMRRSVVHDNYLEGGTTGVRANACDIVITKHNTFLLQTTGVNCTGSTRAYSPNNTFFGVGTNHVNAGSTTAYGPA